MDHEVSPQRREPELLQTLPDDLQTLTDDVSNRHLAGGLRDNNRNIPFPPLKQILRPLEQALNPRLRLAPRPRRLHTAVRTFNRREARFKQQLAVDLQPSPESARVGLGAPVLPPGVAGVTGSTRLTAAHRETGDLTRVS